MEKLIELLNEFANQMMPWWSEYYEKWWNIYLKFKAPLSWEWKIENEVICSKRYDFIKWLVEKDKIDLLRLDNRIALSEFNKVERVLMALSISDTPIEDLVSYLK